MVRVRLTAYGVCQEVQESEHSGPPWTWNDMLTEEHIQLTLRDLAEQNVRQVWVHPRPGLMTPYLSDNWFRIWRVALDEANRLRGLEAAGWDA